LYQVVFHLQFGSTACKPDSESFVENTLGWRGEHCNILVNEPDRKSRTLVPSRFHRAESRPIMT
jgi:hypothetical protein